MRSIDQPPQPPLDPDRDELLHDDLAATVEPKPPLEIVRVTAGLGWKALSSTVTLRLWVLP
jgi:hypothetical protein